MMPMLHDIGLGLVWALASGGFAWYCGGRIVEITYVTLADGRRQERRLPLFYRIVLPFTPNLYWFADRPAMAPVRKDVDRRLVAAGFGGLLNAREFLGLRLLMPMVVGPFFFALVHLALIRVEGRVGLALRQREVLFDLLAMVWLALQPALWLNREVKARHLSIQRALPFVLDLLTLSVEAGLDFMNAIKRIIDRRAVDPLGEELIRVFREVQLGKTRREALRDMADRVGQSDVRTITNALIQADELGVSIGSILRIQSDQMRIRRFNNAEKAANEAPVKMLAPLILFIFPSVFIVLLGPVILRLMREGF